MTSRPFALTCVVASMLLAAGALILRAQAPAGPPAWAYGVPAAGAPAAGRGAAPAPAPVLADDGSPKHLEGSTQAFTLAQVRDGFNVADWYPGDHPEAPAIVMKGRAPAIRACGFCHLANGKGRPENAGLAGLPVAYFTQQIADFRNDARKSAETRKTNTGLMANIAKAMTDDEVKAAAAYFAAISPTPWIRVVEAAEVPKTRIAGGMFMRLYVTETEPIGSRILEMPEDNDRTDLRDPRSGFIAYVPVGSIKRGEALVTTGAGRTLACGTCHGPDLKGLGPVPGLAGRSPSYAVRQMYDMKAGTRKGLWTDLMKAVVANLTDDDLVAIGAYLASKGQ